MRHSVRGIPVFSSQVGASTLKYGHVPLWSIMYTYECSLKVIDSKRRIIVFKNVIS